MMEHQAKSYVKDVIALYLRNNRLDKYRTLLISYLEAEYRIMSLRDYIRLTPENQERNPTLILRHDIDQVSTGTMRMHAIEKELGVTASFYFRWSTADSQIINAITQHGSEASLHYETIATKIKQINLQDRLEITPEFLDECRRQLKLEVDRFRRIYGVEVVTICSHGGSENVAFTITNNMLVHTPELDYPYLAIKMEAYDPELLSKFVYVSDAEPARGGGYRYGIHPMRLISQSRNVYLLTHPHNWHFSMLRRLVRIERVVRKGVTNMPDTFRSHRGKDLLP